MNARHAKPYGGHRRASFQSPGYQDAVAALYGKPPQHSPLPADWRNRLPEPGRYYALHVERLKHASAEGWSSGRCPFHEDKNASLSVNVSHGGWRCFAGCGAGDLVDFHARLQGLDFKHAVADLLGVQP